MILFLIVLGMILLGVILFYSETLAERSKNRYKNSFIKFFYFKGEALSAIPLTFGIVGLFISLLGFLIAGVTATDLQNTLPLDYEKVQIKSQILKEKDFDVNIQTINYLDDLYNWNKQVRWSHKYAHNKWIGIFIPDSYDDYKEIEIPIELKEID